MEYQVEELIVLLNQERTRREELEADTLDLSSELDTLQDEYDTLEEEHADLQDKYQTLVKSIWDMQEGYARRQDAAYFTQQRRGDTYEQL